MIRHPVQALRTFLGLMRHQGKSPRVAWKMTRAMQYRPLTFSDVNYTFVIHTEASPETVQAAVSAALTEHLNTDWSRNAE